MLMSEPLRLQGWPPGPSSLPAVVVIGASAGGLDALQGLLTGLRPNGRTAYVIAQHMANDQHQEMMRHLLQRICRLPVRIMRTEDGLTADMVTLVPAGHQASWQGGRWMLRPATRDDVYTPSVDLLLQSLAEAWGVQATGVILSGAGSDGANGAAALARHGGELLVQSPMQARFDGMPTAVLARVPASQVLRVEDMVARWCPKGDFSDDSTKPAVSTLMALTKRVRHVTGIDFSGYKQETLQRRTLKRMGELGLVTWEDYLWHLEQNAEEAWVLKRRFLVSVSSFFRDKAAFDALGQAWRGSRQPRGLWRCWVPACATGEEAYSLSMLYAEGVRESLWSGEFEVLGTDLNEEALSHARHASYAAKAMREVDVTLLDRYFSQSDGRFTVDPAVRNCVRFDCQDLLATQPEGPWNVVSCRNLLIYLQTPVQEKLLADIHARMAPGGWLFISPMETLPQASLRWFAPVDMDHRIYRRLT